MFLIKIILLETEVMKHPLSMRFVLLTFDLVIKHVYEWNIKYFNTCEYIYKYQSSSMNLFVLNSVTKLSHVSWRHSIYVNPALIRKLLPVPVTVRSYGLFVLVKHCSCFYNSHELSVRPQRLVFLPSLQSLFIGKLRFFFFFTHLKLKLILRMSSSHLNYIFLPVYF